MPSAVQEPMLSSQRKDDFRKEMPGAASIWEILQGEVTVSSGELTKN